MLELGFRGQRSGVRGQDQGSHAQVVWLPRETQKVPRGAFVAEISRRYQGGEGPQSGSRGVGGTRTSARCFPQHSYRNPNPTSQPQPRSLPPQGPRRACGAGQGCQGHITTPQTPKSSTTPTPNPLSYLLINRPLRLSNSIGMADFLSRTPIPTPTACPLQDGQHHDLLPSVPDLSTPTPTPTPTPIPIPPINYV